MNRIISLLIILLLSLPFGGDLMMYAKKQTGKKETKESISRRKQRNKKEINDTNKKIKNNTREVKKQLGELDLVTADIEECQKSINTMKGGIRRMDVQIKALNDSVIRLDNRITTLSDKYAKAIRKMQTRNSGETSEFAFIFSANSFSEAYHRRQSLKQFAKWRQKKSEELTELKSELDARRETLEEKKSRRVAMLDSLNSVLATLSEKQEQSDRLVAMLEREGTNLRNILQQKQNEADELDRELDRLIQQEQEELRKAEEERKKAEKARLEKEKQQRELKEKQQRERKEKEAREKAESKNKGDKKNDKNKGSNGKKKEKAPKKPVAKPEQKKPQPVAKGDDKVKPVPGARPVEKQKPPVQKQTFKDFASAKGSLPYPAKGKIVKHFGRQQHPDLKHVVTDNPGIDIETRPGADVSCVFNGQVSDIFRLPGYNTIVMIRHGSYLTIYANLGSISVKKGDKIVQGQVIGKVFKDGDDNDRSVLHFEVRNERSKENPELWLK